MITPDGALVLSLFLPVFSSLSLFSCLLRNYLQSTYVWFYYISFSSLVTSWTLLIIPIFIFFIQYYCVKPLLLFFFLQFLIQVLRILQLNIQPCSRLHDIYFDFSYVTINGSDAHIYRSAITIIVCRSRFKVASLSP